MISLNKNKFGVSLIYIVSNLPADVVTQGDPLVGPLLLQAGVGEDNIRQYFVPLKIVKFRRIINIPIYP